MNYKGSKKKMRKKDYAHEIYSKRVNAKKN